MVFHVLNRGVGRRTLFEKESDYLAFEKVLAETLHTRPMRICAYCLMPNHWHFVLWPEKDGELSAFMQQLTNTHAKRWKHYRQETGDGHLYQGRYKSSQCKPRTISIKSFVMSSEMLCVPTWRNEQNLGHGQV
jgi:putative transposase